MFGRNEVLNIYRIPTKAKCLSPILDLADMAELLIAKTPCKSVFASGKQFRSL